MSNVGQKTFKSTFEGFAFSMVKLFDQSCLKSVTNLRKTPCEKKLVFRGMFLRAHSIMSTNIDPEVLLFAWHWFIDKALANAYV